MAASKNGSDNSPESRGWKPGKRDAFFLAFVAAVVLLLMLSGERTTKPTPNDVTHQKAASLESIAACMACHNADGIHPQPKQHIKPDSNCFQCHVEPESRIGAK